LPADYQFPDGPSLVPPIPFIVAPKDRMSGARVRVEVASINGVRTHTNHLYIHGWTTYRDIFPGTPEHVSMFCFELTEVRADPTYSTVPIPVTWSECTGVHHNCSDEDCNGEHYGNGHIWQSRSPR
jgi:hypothetical protein